MGIDPGLKGGIAVVKINKRGKLQSFIWEGCDKDSLKLSLVYKPNWVYVEKQQSMRGQGLVSTFTTAMNYGFIQGYVERSGLDYKLVHAKTWMHSVKNFYSDVSIHADLQNLSIKETKKLNLSICLSIFNREDLITSRGRWKDGIADALLIALYGFIDNGILLGK